MTIRIKVPFVVICLLIFNACATYKPQYKDAKWKIDFPEKAILHSFYLIGDAGNSPLGSSSGALKAFKNELAKASKNSTAIFLGDNIYPKGMPKKGKEGREFAEHQLNIQTAAVSNFKGRTIFIPGNHDWYNKGVKGLKRQENYIEDILGKNSFLPENGCPIEKVEITDDIVLLIVDSVWYLANWDDNPTINDECEIKTRTKFFDELESEIKKARGKTTVLAIHHPMFTNGSHGGQYPFSSHMSPLPVLGTLKNIIRKTGGVTTVDIQNELYNEFRKRIITLSQENDKTIFVSGHDHNLQYIVQDNLPQIISGSGSKVNATRNVGNGQFSYGTPGYARLDIFEDGSSHVRFFSAEDDKVVFQKEVLQKDQRKSFITYPISNIREKSSSIYSKEEVTKGKAYTKLWGERYRKYYGTEVIAPIVNLDTLFGGLTPIRKGGGHQSKSLRLKDKQGREYVMRALRKNAIQYMQAVAFKDQYIEGKFNDTYAEDLLLDIFTGAHPYAPFTIGTLSDALGIFHTNPVLYYVPKQNAIGHFNDEFGDELYMIEERTSDGHGDKASFGFSNKLLSTDDLLKKLNKNEDHILDESSYIRARLFDMLIGDWDRHEDQWRWASFKEDGKTVYRPIPRDRDQAFSIMADGVLLNIATTLVPALRLMRSYDEELKSPKWFNLEPYPLDIALINQSDREVWNAEVKHIVKNLTDEVIDEAFTYFPDEVKGETINDIKRKLKGRRSNLQTMSDSYYKHINKFAVIKGTNKDDWFEVDRMANGKTKVTAFRIKKGEKGDVFHERTYTRSDTKEIWIYALDDDDVFKVSGEGDNPIKVRLIGGQNNDTYDIQNGKGIVNYDYQSKKNTFTTNKGRNKLREDYESNVYDYKKLKNNTFSIAPQLGFNPDDGLQFGIANTYTSFGFERNPFTSQNTISAGYYTATSGYVLDYYGEFANFLKDANLGINIHYNSPNYAVNFFGFGNETENPEADEEDGLDVDLDYNRVKIRTFRAKPSIYWHGRAGGSFTASLSYESHKIERTEDRFIATLSSDDPLFDNQDFYGVDTKYQFVNKNNDVFPTLGLLFSFQTGFKNNMDTNKGFGYIIPELAIDYKLGAAGKVVLATHVKAHVNIGDGFQFYQGASIGANNGLRGFRNERYTGKSAFVQSTDLRWNFTNLKTGLMPLSIGVYGGADYGRVWVEDGNSEKWNNSFGGGLFVNFAGFAVGNISAFNSDDGVRLAFKLGFGF